MEDAIDKYFWIGVIVFFLLPGFVYSMGRAWRGKNPDK